MKSKFLFPLILVAGLMFVNFSVYQVYGQTSQNEPAKQQTVMYTCSMHPEVVQDHPGKCPKCGMKLIEKKDMPKADLNQVNDSTMMKKDPMKMKYDSTTLKKDHMVHDTTSMKHDQMKK